MYVIRRQSDGWYYTHHHPDTFHPDIREAATFLAPPVAIMAGVYAEEREPASVSTPAILLLAAVSWVMLYYLVVGLAWVRHHG